MNRCVVIHPTGATELQDFHPVLHQRLRGLGYRRFVIQFVRTSDERMLSSAVYARLAPSAWHVSEAARKLWGRGTGEISVFDEQGERVDANIAVGQLRSSTFTPAASSPAVAPAPSPVAAPVPTRDAGHLADATGMAHRLRSLAHHWLYLVDRNDGNAAAFDELFTDEFMLDWAPAGIRTRAELAVWYHGTSQRVLRSRHTLVGFEHEARDAGRWLVRLELEWVGVARSQPDQELEALIRHEWTVTHDPSEHFARIETAKIELLSPARPAAR